MGYVRCVLLNDVSVNSVDYVGSQEGQAKGKMKRVLAWVRGLKGTFTNREIVFFVLLWFVIAGTVQFHWIGLFIGFLTSFFVTSILRGIINARYDVKKLFGARNGRSDSSNQPR